LKSEQGLYALFSGIFLNEILDFHDSVDVCVGLMGCDAIWRKYVPPKYWYPPTSPHDIKAQKTSIDRFFAVKKY
jgi:hypothetical protein